MAMGLPSVTSAVFLIANSFWYNVPTFQSRRNIIDVSATPLGLKRSGVYICRECIVVVHKNIPRLKEEEKNCLDLGLGIFYV
jgi:hypothetical protein